MPRGVWLGCLVVIAAATLYFLQSQMPGQIWSLYCPPPPPPPPLPLERFRATKSSIALFYHMAAINDWKAIARDQFHQLEDSGLLSVASQLHVTILGNRSNYTLDGLPFLSSRKTFLHFVADPRLYEYPTLVLLYHYCRLYESDYVAYFHAKGSRGRAHAKDWRDALQHFLFYRWLDCVEALSANGYDACGTNFKPRPRPHFSGNFWWASCSYVATLPVPAADAPFGSPIYRLWAEYWLMHAPGPLKPRVKNCFDTNTDHYYNPFNVTLVRNRTCNTP